MLAARIAALLLLIAPSAGALLVVLPFAPSWQPTVLCAILGGAAAAFACGVVLLFRGMAPPLYRRKLFAGLALVAAVTITLAEAALLVAGWIFEPDLVRVLPIADGRSAYLYERSCFPPDSAAECGNYRAEIRMRLRFLPFETTAYACKCLFGDVRIDAGAAEIPLEANESSAERSLRLDLHTGNITGTLNPNHSSS